jgi:hypothetical protein
VLSARQNTNLYENADGYAIIEYGDGDLDHNAPLPTTILYSIRDKCGETACNPSGGLGFSTLVVNSDRANDLSDAGSGICETLLAALGGVGLVNAGAGAGTFMLLIGCGLLIGCAGW